MEIDEIENERFLYSNQIEDTYQWDNAGVKCCCTALHEQLVNALHQAKCSGEAVRSKQLFNFQTDDVILILFKCLYQRNFNDFKGILDQSDLSSDELSSRTFRNLTLLQYACYDNQLEVVELLLERNISVTFSGTQGTPPLVAAAETGNEKLLKCLLQREPSSIDIANNEGDTALHIAARQQNLQVVQFLLRNHARPNVRNRLGVMPLPGNVLKGLLNQCVVVTPPESQTQLDEPNVRIDFELLLNLAQNTKTTELKLLLNIGEDRNTRELLTHPLSKAFLAFKWQRVRYWHFTYLLLHIVFVAIINSCFYVQGHIFKIIITSILIPIWIFWVAKEMVQLLSSPRVYLRSSENFLDIAIIFSSIVAIFSLYLWMNKWLNQVIHLLSIFTSFGKLMELTGRVPRYALQIEIFKRVSQSCLNVLIWYLPVMVAFTLAFHSFYDNHICTGFSPPSPDFCTFVTSFYRTFIMMIGEFEGSTIHEVSWLIRPVVLVFIFCVVLVMFNVLIGLAVSDTRRLRTRADLYATRARVKAIWSIEQAIAKWNKEEEMSTSAAILVTSRKKGYNLHLEKDKSTEACLDSQDIRAVLEILSARIRGSNMNRLHGDLAVIKQNLDNLLQYFKNNEQ